jgi:hypothetical protein
MHPPSTIRFAIENMTFPTRSTRFNRRKQRRLQYISISHHLSTQPLQYTTPCNLLAAPPKLTTHTHAYYTIHSTHPSKVTIPCNHTNKLFHLTAPLCTHSCPPLFYLAFSRYMACLVGYLVRKVCKATRHDMSKITTCSVRKML